MYVQSGSFPVLQFAEYAEQEQEYVASVLSQGLNSRLELTGCSFIPFKKREREKNLN